MTAAAQAAPEALVEQLRPGGRLVMPIGGQEVQQLSVLEKGNSGDVRTHQLMPVRFTRLEVGA